MAEPAPKIDQRTATDIAAQVQALLETYAPAWKEFDPQTGKPEGVSAALIGIFSRFAEIIIQRLNRMPEKNFLAFLDLLGASLLPPQPARVPLTFSLAAGSSVDGVVPAGTQVAAAPAEGEKEPVIFETERELVVTAARLASVFVRDPEQDTYSDHSSITTSAASPGVLIFQGNRRIEHMLYFGHRQMLGFPQIANLRLIFTLDKALGDGGELEWQIWNGTKWENKEPQGASNLSQTGDNEIDFGSITPIPTSHVSSVANRWVRCRLIPPITRASEALSGMVRESRLPDVCKVQIEVDLRRQASQGLSPELAFTNSLPIDLGKDFFPFGEQPKLNDTLYLASTEAFSKDRAEGLASTSAMIDLDIQVANSHLLPSAGSVWPSDDLQLAWECWNGANWQRVGTSTSPPWLSLLELDPLPPLITDSGDEAPNLVVQGTAQKGSAVTIEVEATGFSKTVAIGDDGRFATEITLSSDVNVIACTVHYKNRTTKAWAAIFQGTPAEQSIQLIIENVPDVPVPTEKHELELKVAVQGTKSNLIKYIRVTNGSALDVAPKEWDISENPQLIPLSEGRNELLVEGLYQDKKTGAAATVMISREADKPAPVQKTGFADGTYAFCQSGTVTVRLPDTVRQRVVNGQDAYWLRVRLPRGDYGKDASYVLKDPTDPTQGFMLVLPTFKPPILSKIKVGYEQKLEGEPGRCLVYNNLVFDEVTSPNKVGNSSFKPFHPAPEDLPTLYLGYKLLPERTAFPNRTISLFTHMAHIKYGEKSVPLSPLKSKASGAPGSVVTHNFFITNATPLSAEFELTILGTRWSTEVVPPSIELDAGEVTAVRVQVTIPSGTQVGDRDSGFLRVIGTEDPVCEHSATFVTFAGTEFSSGERLQLAWEYWNGTWSRLTVCDESENFTRPGLVQFLAPSDFTSHSEFGLDRYWLRVRWESGEYVFAPSLRRMLLNTTMAAQTVTISNEILGSSDGGESQTFHTTRAPILLGQQLEIREPELPSTEERAGLEKEEGGDAVSIGRYTAGRPKEIWVRWHEVPDFYGSGPRDRHYVLDHITGEIRFGNGLNGLIPPTGTGNFRMARYQTGGGIAGNRDADTIVQLKTTVPYVDKVTNPEAATGGANAETLDSLLEQAPRTLRHRGRAVTLEDYEDLAMLASPEVERAKCIPLRNLFDDPLDTKPITPGKVSVIIVPRSKNAKPLPGMELISRVQDHLEANAVPTVNVSVVGPLYVSVNITAEIALASLEGASAVEQAVYQELVSFLHPLTGGSDGIGWDFGREPHKSDFYALIEGVAGVDHVRAFKVDAIEDQPGIKNTGRFLVYSGKHEINLVFKE